MIRHWIQFVASLFVCVSATTWSTTGVTVIIVAHMLLFPSYNEEEEEDNDDEQGVMIRRRMMTNDTARSNSHIGEQRAQWEVLSAIDQIWVSTLAGVAARMRQKSGTQWCWESSQFPTGV
jgi:hypothetical protein